MLDLTTSLFAICFCVGLIFTLVSLLGGIGHLGGHVGGDSSGLGHFHVGHGDSGVAHTGHHSAGSSELGDGVSFLNLSSLTVFLTWFGATGLCLKLYGKLGLAIVLILSCLLGLFGAYIVYLFLTKFLLKGQSKPLSAKDTYMPGTAAKVISTISAGGTGEIVYVHLNTRRSCGARSVDGVTISKGTKVVIMQYVKGIAYVKPCLDLIDTDE